MQVLWENLKMFGSKPGLGRIKKLLKKWGNPQDKLKVILITGTNGKGSTTSYLSSILKQEGYKVGSFYSPHLVKYNERIRINGKMISNKEFGKYSKQVMDYFNRGNDITFFEAITAIAFKYFKDKKCDYVVMEIGMGGRLDACNIAKEKIAIITNVGKEHTKHLGNTEEKIAFEKIGILKKGIGITGAEGKALEKMKKEAKKRKKELIILGENFKIKNIKTSEKGTKFDYYGNNIYRNLKLEMIGDYQAKNASLAVKAGEILRVKEKNIRKGLKGAKILGRMELIKKNGKRILIDVAHNPNGTKELVKNLKLFEYDRLYVLFGVLKDKNWKKMLRVLEKKADEIIFTGFDYYRAEDPKKLKKFFGKGKVILDPREGIKELKKIKRKDLFLITGSIYFIGKIIDSL